ncbi:MAG: T9SS type A sorting domain-containing protein [Flavobacteriaceae bacterium]
MKKKLLLLGLTIVFAGGLFFVTNTEKNSEEKRRAEFAEFLKNHEYSKRKLMTKEELKAIPKADRPDLAFEQDFLRTIDPVTHELNREGLLESIKLANELQEETRTVDFTWESRGPRDVSGRTRAVMFDPNDVNNERIFAGGVGGGIWMNTDVTDENISWTQVAPGAANFAVTAMDYDPVITTNFYAGTGEGWGNIDAINGAGIMKSSDGGSTWSSLASTTGFDFVYDLVVRNEGGSEGVIYAIMRDAQNTLSAGTDLFRSTDGGTTWTVATTSAFRDLEIASDNTLWAGGFNGTIYNSTDGTTWNLVYTTGVGNPGRVELGVAPSNSDVVYALISGSNQLGEVVRTTSGGLTWTAVSEPADNTDGSVPATDFTRGQAWYDLIITVDPAEENTVHVGGVNTFKSTDGGSNWAKTSSWSSGWDNSVSFVHADIHNIVYRPGNNALVYGTDGGIFYAPDVNAIPTSGPNAYTTGIFARNLNYNVTQFYSAAIDPINTNAFMGGTQDNGTHYFNSAGIDDTQDYSGGDGGFAFIDQTAVNATDGVYYIVSNTGNAYRMHDFSTSTFNIDLIVNGNNGSFINPADYDDVNNVLYSNNGNNQVTTATLAADLQPQSVGGVFQGTRETITISLLASNATITHLRVSPHNPTPSQRALFVGTSTGNLVKRTLFNETNITNPSVTGAVSSVEVGASDDELIVTYSNYGIVSVWYTSDGGTTWENKEGNLPDMPVRWSLFNPLDRKEVILATEAGIWRTSDITATNPVWGPVSSGMGNVRVDMLQYRASDNVILAGTHGRGMFTSVFTATPASVDEVLTDKKVFTVYPTISEGDFTVFAKNDLGNSKLSIFDLAGQQVYSSELNFNNKSNQEVSVNLKSGVYIVNLIDENNRKSSSKIIIK